MSTAATDRRFWSVKEAAAYIPVSAQALYDWIRVASGEGTRPNKGAKLLGKPPPFRRFGRKKILIPIDAFKAWVEDSSNN